MSEMKRVQTTRARRTRRELLTGAAAAAGVLGVEANAQAHHLRQQSPEQIAILGTASTRDSRIRERRGDFGVAGKDPALQLLLPVHGLSAQLLVRRVRIDEELGREEATHIAPNSKARRTVRFEPNSMELPERKLVSAPFRST